MEHWSNAPREIPIPKPVQLLFHVFLIGYELFRQTSSMPVDYQTYYITMGPITYPCLWHLKDPGIYVYESVGLDELMKDSQVACL